MYSMSAKELRNTMSLFARYSRSQACFRSLKRFSIPNRPKFIEPMLSDATSGLWVAAGATRCWMVMVGAPPW
jgi:hypothetical protein